MAASNRNSYRTPIKKTRPKHKTPEQLQAECDKWNAANAVGAMVSYSSIKGRESHRARSVGAAWVIGNHSAGVLLEGMISWVHLSKCVVVSDAGVAA